MAHDWSISACSEKGQSIDAGASVEYASGYRRHGKAGRASIVSSGELDLLVPCSVVNVTAETNRAATPTISQHQTSLLASEPGDARQAASPRTVELGKGQL